MSRGDLHRAVVVACLALLAARAEALEAEDEALGFERTPPRLGYLDGDVSFWRPGAGDWSPARVNTALAAGDELYTSGDANLELQVGPSAFVRAGEATQLTLSSLEPDFLQLRLTEGRLSLDLRRLKASQTIEVDTPNAAFTVEHTGYYRVEVEGEVTTFTSRRGGRATVTPASGDSAAVAPSEQVVVTGADAPELETYAAPDLDDWDRWNYARTEGQIDSVSARYVAPGVYGTYDLDRYGDWRLVPSYGAIWVPRAVAVGWAPYSTGRWMYDPFYGWTWVDDAPWGWAPFHYGRWVYVSGYWGWCPGPIVVRPYYAPALVAFYGGSGASIGISIGGPYVGWVALGWGEPLLPWWGPSAFRLRPRWAGWGGPRVVNNVVVEHTTVIDVRKIHVYRNAGVHGAVVALHRDHFGRHPGRGSFARVDAAKLAPLHGELPVKPDRTSLVADARSARRPPGEVRARAVVATREPRPDRVPDFASHGAARPDEAAQSHGAARPTRLSKRTAPAELPAATPPVRIVEPPREGKRIKVSARPPFGRHAGPEREIPPPAPRYGGMKRGEGPAARSYERPEARRREERSQGVEARRHEERRELPETGTREERGDRPQARGREERGEGAEVSHHDWIERPQARGRDERGERPPPRRHEERGERHPREEARPPAALEPTRTPLPPEPSGGHGEARAQHEIAPGRHAGAPPAPRELPGEPASRVYRRRTGPPSGAPEPPAQAPEVAPGRGKGRSFEPR
jgi:hypothetical protein